MSNVLQIRDQVEWSRAYNDMISKDLYGYVKSLHTTGLVWNKGVSCSLISWPVVQLMYLQGSVLSSAPAAAPPVPSGGGPPPPPPPAIQPPDAAPPSKAAGDSSAMRASLFADINKGTDVTRGKSFTCYCWPHALLCLNYSCLGLKKVTPEMQTHKNKKLVQSSVVKADAVAPTSKSTPKFGSAQTKKPPVLALQGKKWIVVSSDYCLCSKLVVHDPKQTDLCQET